MTVEASEACLLCRANTPRDHVFERGGWRLLRCRTCGLVQQDPLPGPADLDRAYYADEAFSERLDGDLRAFTLARAREKQDLVDALLPVGHALRVLDVGCSSGAWIEVAEARGWQATGVELGPTTAARARARGLDVRTGTLADVVADLPSGGFDLVTFWDVLEHLRDPGTDLDLARTLLTPGGIVAATFPNVDGWYPRATLRLLAGRTGVWEHPELPVHLYDFNPSTAATLFRAHGFVVVDQRTTATPFAFFRGTSLSTDAIGGSPRRRVAVRSAFEALRAVVYPLAALRGAGNAQFIAARVDHPA